MKQIFFIFCIILIANACEFSAPKGKWGDVIKFSTTQLSYDARGGVATITSVGDWWWIYEIRIDGQDYSLPTFSLPTFSYEIRDTTIIWEDMTVVCGHLPEMNFIGVVKIEGLWFTITRETTQKIVFFVAPNKTGKNRMLQLLVEDGDYFTGITVTQAAE